MTRAMGYFLTVLSCSTFAGARSWAADEAPVSKGPLKAALADAFRPALSHPLAGSDMAQTFQQVKRLPTVLTHRFYRALTEILAIGVKQDPKVSIGTMHLFAAESRKTHDRFFVVAIPLLDESGKMNDIEFFYLVPSERYSQTGRPLFGDMADNAHFPEYRVTGYLPGRKLDERLEWAPATRDAFYAMQGQEFLLSIGMLLRSPDGVNLGMDQIPASEQTVNAQPIFELLHWQSSFIADGAMPDLAKLATEAEGIRQMIRDSEEDSGEGAPPANDGCAGLLH